MQYFYDIRGNLLEVKDPYNRKVFEYVYDLRPPQKGENGEQQPLPPLWTKHIDQGEGKVLFDATGKPIETEDVKGAVTLSAYDTLSRQTQIWVKDKTGEDITLRQILIYGDDVNDGPSNPKTNNYLGQLYKHYDEAGLVTINGYDFKGNLLEKDREVISDTDLLAVFNGPPTNWEVDCFRVDWANPPTLEGNYLTTMEYDAMNRVTKMTYPEDVETERKEFVPTYNRAGALESVKMNGNDYVNHIAYNAKGQRLLIAHGNNIMTRYVYDSKQFRLLRIRSEKYIQNNWMFTPDGGVKQDSKYKYDLTGNIVGTNEANVSECGIGGTNSLEREFNYDPLYRILNANGRENSPTISPIWDDRYRSSDNTTTTAYTQNYSYDRLGNIQKLQHIGNNNFTRNFNYISTNNQLQSIGIGMTNYDFSYDECGNQVTETSSRHFEWDFGNRLRAFYVQAGTSEPTQYAQYLYDAGGTRIKKVVRVQGGNYTSTTYIDDVFEYKTDGTDEQNLLHIMDDTSRIAMIRLGYTFGDTTPAIKYNLEDHLGNSTVLLETNGSLINKEEYYPFGETSFGSYGKKRYKFSGKERDEESGLYYCRFRYHSAWTCRFISVDPLAPEYPYNSSYAYAENKVISGKELEGLEMIEVNDTGINLTAAQNESGTYSFSLGEKKFDNVEIVTHNGVDYFNIGEHMHYDSEIGWNDEGIGSKLTTNVKYSFTYRQNYKIKTIESWIPFMSGKEIEIMPDGEISNYSETPSETETYEVTLKYPEKVADHTEYVYWGEYKYSGSLEGMDNSDNWKKQTNAGQAFIDGFQNGLFVGLFSGGLSSGIGAEVNLYRSKIAQAKNYVKNLSKSRHNIRYSKNLRMDFKGRNPKSKGHFNKKTQEQLNYPHVADPKYPGGVRSARPSDWIKIYNEYLK
jgi:RHS repeat-associated protein